MIRDSKESHLYIRSRTTAIGDFTENASGNSQVFSLTNAQDQPVAATDWPGAKPRTATRLHLFVYARHGRDFIRCKSPVRDWESQGDQYTK